MAYRSLSLVPALSNHLLSDRFTQMDNLFSRLTGEAPLADTPAYNLIQKDKAHYEMAVSVPGYTQDELDISVLNNQLTLSGKPGKDSENTGAEQDHVKWLHHGIKKSEFSLSLSLDHRITIQKADLKNGLLTLKFTYDIPDQEKPKKIAIGGHSDPSLEHNAS